MNKKLSSFSDVTCSNFTQIGIFLKFVTSKTRDFKGKTTVFDEQIARQNCGNDLKIVNEHDLFKNEKKCFVL